MFEPLKGWKGYLPIGSIVITKEIPEIRLCIIGRGFPHPKEFRKKIDYIAVKYPEGFDDDAWNEEGFNESFVIFQHEDILNVIQKGFVDYEEHEFLERVDEIYARNLNDPEIEAEFNKRISE